MDYFAGLDILMDETHVCVLDREGVRRSARAKAAPTAEAIADELSKAPSCRRIVFETGTNGSILFHGLNPAWSPSGLCREPCGQAYQALKLFTATHKTDRNGCSWSGAPRGPHWLLQARACEVAVARTRSARRSARARSLVGQRVTLEKPDPRLGGCVRADPAPSCAHRRIHRPGSQSQRRESRVSPPLCGV